MEREEERKETSKQSIKQAIFNLHQSVHTEQKSSVSLSSAEKSPWNPLSSIKFYLGMPKEISVEVIIWHYREEERGILRESLWEKV